MTRQGKQTWVEQHITIFSPAMQSSSFEQGTQKRYKYILTTIHTTLPQTQKKSRKIPRHFAKPVRKG